MTRSLSLAGAIAGLLLSNCASHAQTPDGTLYFNEDSDSIGIDGQTVLGNASTYEAWIYLTPKTQNTGNVFNEQTDFLEDKALSVGTTLTYGYNHPTTGTITRYDEEITQEEWHHFAFVHDGAAGTQGLYIDGQRVASQSASSEIGDGPGLGYIGSILRAGVPTPSFHGFIDSLRISDVARYSGESFALPVRDLPADANAVILYHFAEGDYFQEQGETRITDLSGTGRHGTFGAGYAQATAPAVPGRQGDLDCNGEVNATDALKDLRAAVGSSVTQTEPCPDPKEPLTTGLFGDIDCSGTVSATDALGVLKYSVGLSVAQTPPCPAFLDPV